MLKQPNEQKRVFLSKLESESTRKGATCEAELTSTRFSKKCLEYTVRVNVAWGKKKKRYVFIIPFQHGKNDAKLQGL